MADISKCANELCRRKDTCYRWVAPASEYQWYVTVENREVDCGLYWEVVVSE